MQIREYYTHKETLRRMDERDIAGYLKFHPEMIDISKSMMEPDSWSLVSDYLQSENNLEDSPNYEKIKSEQGKISNREITDKMVQNYIDEFGTDEVGF